MYRLKKVQPTPLKRDDNYYWFIPGSSVYHLLSPTHPPHKELILNSCRYLTAIDVVLIEGVWYWIIKDKSPQ